MRVKRTIRRALLLAALCVSAVHLTAQDAGARTTLPLPRFVSLKASAANVRQGPGLRYNILWTYVRRGIPVEIFQEFGNWRRIRGSDGKSGWIYAALVSGRRTATVAPWVSDLARLRPSPSLQSAPVAHLEPGVLLHDLSCDGTWCRVSVQHPDVTGYVRQSALWGVYPGETLNWSEGWNWLSFL
ncbi:SH3 domain-containing protein [Aurantimonas sp. VKM B-3413]|uniref:SH3 domain-containing protein n=1 Tax=Aurantimonas sp. VKM B-3413 TaxID=2779401 RepID=UPI00351CF2BA|nr:SH3 domain-containing protein [Aurantimonas sp. VKM B-3413]